MIEDGYHDAGDRRLLRIGIDPELPEFLIYLMIKNKVRSVEALDEKLRSKPATQRDASDRNSSSE